jgi:hypothetical protein
MTANKNILLISLSSRRLINFIDDGLEKLNITENQETDIFIFDIFEVLNGLFFKNTSLGEKTESIEKIIKNVYEKIYNNLPKKGDIFKYSKDKKMIKEYMNLVYSEFIMNPRFERHIKNQIFQNLQPKLREHNITNNKSNLLEIMAPFLLTEIALYLYIYNTDTYNCVFGLESEMQILDYIKKRKYENINPYFKYKKVYCKIVFYC